MERHADKTAGQDIDEIRKQAIVDALTGFTAEMKLLDVADLIAFIRTEKHGNIEDLISSAAELFFKDGTLRYGMAASVDVDWDRAPTISLDLEFYNKSVWVYFTLVLAEPSNAINVSYIEVKESDDEDMSNTERLLSAIADAQLRPRKTVS